MQFQKQSRSLQKSRLRAVPVCIVLAAALCGCGGHTPDLPEAPPETGTTASAQPSDALRPELRDAIDDCEGVFSGYADFMQQYTDAGSPPAMLDGYYSWQKTYEAYTEKFRALEETDMTPEERAYYLAAAARIEALHTP